MPSARYWRLNVTVSNGGATNTQLGEMELRATAGGPNLSVTGSGTASSSPNPGGGAAALAFDGNIASVWGNAGTGLPAWLKWDFGAGNEKDIAFLTLKNPNNADAAAAPATASLQWSNDDATWTDFIYVGAHPGTQSFVGTYGLPNLANVALTAPSPVVTFFGGASASLAAPKAVLSFFGGGAAQINAPSARVVITGGANATLTGTFPTFFASGHNSTGENDFAGTAPMASLAFAGGANARLTAPSSVLSVSATFSGIGTADLTAPAALVDASRTTGGTASANLRAPMGKLVGYFGGVISVTTTNSPTLVASGTANPIGSAALAAPMASAIGYSGAVCSITLTGRLTLLATGSGGGVGVATLSCPLFELTASGTAQNSGRADLLAPSPRMGATAQAWLIAPGATLTAIGTAVVSITYEAYNVNLKHKVRMQGEALAIDEMTHYTNFPFDRIVRYQNSYFGVAADGLYLLEGTTDDGAAIACALETHVDDFGAPEKKTIVSARFGGRFGPTATVTLHVGETGETAYPYTTPRGQLAQNYREKFGRGIKNRYFGLKVETSGALEIDQLELEINKLTRRI